MNDAQRMWDASTLKIDREGIKWESLGTLQSLQHHTFEGELVKGLQLLLEDANRQIKILHNDLYRSNNDLTAFIEGLFV
jgi:hypothetical protein